MRRGLLAGLVSGRLSLCAYCVVRNSLYAGYELNLCSFFIRYFMITFSYFVYLCDSFHFG